MARDYTIDPGELKERVTLQSRSVAQDAYGQDTITWTTVATVWARVRPLSGREFFAAAQTQQEQTIKAVIRYRADILHTWRLVWQGRAHDITGIAPIGREWVELMLRDVGVLAAALETVATPVFSPVAGIYGSTQSVTITSATIGASIYYTNDGSTPNATKTLYTGAISVAADVTLKAIAIKAAMTDSAVATAAYVISAAWDPVTALFGAGEVGVVFDPSDLTTMFQVINGSMPVTASGQVMGTILDKSKPLGAELLSNGSFDAGISGWVLLDSNGGSVVWDSVNQSMKITSASAYQRAKASFSTTIGKTYLVRGTLLSDTNIPYFTQSNIAIYSVEPPAGPLAIMYFNSGASEISIIFTAEATISWIMAAVEPDAGAWVVNIGNLSVKEVQSNTGIAPSDAARPLSAATGIAEWINYDAVDDVVNVTFPSSLGAACTVARANVGAGPTILTAQTIGTSYADSTDNAGLVIVNRALTGPETTELTAWLTAKGATS